jgi:hypothetical protein
MDISKVQYRVFVLKKDGTKVYFDNLLQEGSHEEGEGELAARLEVTLKNIKTQRGWIHPLVAPGAYVFLQATDGNGWKEVFRGRVYRWNTSPDNDHIVGFTAYDPLYPLQQSKEHKYYKKGETAVSCIKSLASQWNIPLGKIDGPNTKLAKKLYRSTRIGEIIADRLEEARKKGGGRYVVRSTKDKLDVVAEGSNSTVYTLDQDFVETSTDERNIESLITRVKIYGDEDDEGRAPVKAVKNGRTEFGVLQEIIYSSSYDSMTEANKAADEILKEDGKPKVTRSISGPDIPWIRKGDKVKVASGTIGKRGPDGKWEPEECIVTGVYRDLINLRMTLTLRGE